MAHIDLLVSELNAFLEQERDGMRALSKGLSVSCQMYNIDVMLSNTENVNLFKINFRKP